MLIFKRNNSEIKRIKSKNIRLGYGTDKIDFISSVTRTKNVKYSDQTNIEEKLAILNKRGLKREDLDKIKDKLNTDSSFKQGFLASNPSNLNELLKDNQVEPPAFHKPSLLPRIAVSPEPFGEGFNEVIIAVDPKGKWVIQAAKFLFEKDKYQISFRYEIFKLNGSDISYDKCISVPVESLPDKYFSIKIYQTTGLNFSSDGQFVWIFLNAIWGYDFNSNYFKSYLIKLKTADWSYTVVGPLLPYNESGEIRSTGLFEKFALFKQNGVEKLIAPNVRTTNSVIMFDASNPSSCSNLLFGKSYPTKFERFMDVKIKNGMILLVSWHLESLSEGFFHPYLLILKESDLSVGLGPYIIKEMFGPTSVYSSKPDIPRIKLRISEDGKTAYIIVDSLFANDGSYTDAGSAFAAIDIKSGSYQVRYFPKFIYNNNQLPLQKVKDIIEFDGKIYLSMFINTGNSFTKGLYRLDNDLNITQKNKLVPEDWLKLTSFIPHPTRKSDVIIGDLISIDQPMSLNSLVGIWESF